MSDLSLNNFTVSNLSLAISPTVNYTNLPTITNPNTIGYIASTGTLIASPTIPANSWVTILSFSSITFPIGIYMIYTSTTPYNIVTSPSTSAARVCTQLILNNSPNAFNSILGSAETSVASQTMATTHVWTNTAQYGTVSLQIFADGGATIASGLVDNLMQVVRIA